LLSVQDERVIWGVFLRGIIWPGKLYTPFDAWARQFSVISVSKDSGCWFGEELCLDGRIGNLTMDFWVNTG
jgi:hypothetical protein